MATTNNNPSDVNLAENASPVRFDAHHGIVLAAQLAVSAPADLEPRGKTMLARVATNAERVTSVLIARGKTSVGGLRPIILGVDTAYGALHGRLVAAAKLPPSVGDIGARATAILETVLVDGVAFLVNDAETKYAESARRLAVIADEKLEREIDRIAGAGFLDAVKSAHAALGEAIGVGATPVRYARAELQQAVAALAVAIADYCHQVASQVDRFDAASVARYRAAMMPMDRFRADRTSTAVDEEEDATPTPMTSTTTTTTTTPGVPALPSPFITADAE